MGFLDVLEKFSPGVREVRGQIPGYRAWWDQQNDEVLATLDAERKLWVVLGDSASQGVGASSPEHGWVWLVLQGLRRQHPGWQVLNLSVSGQRLHHLLDEHLPRLEALQATHHLQPQLVTCAIGGNDLIPTPTVRLEAQVAQMVRRVPEGTVLCNLPQGLRPRKARQVNLVLETEAARRGLATVDLWSHSGRPWKGKFAADRFHPSDQGYAGIATVMAEALGVRLETDGQSP